MKEIMTRQASENLYLHKDFHVALYKALEYLESQYGRDSVCEYLQQFAQAFYADLKESLKAGDLNPLKEHFKRIFELEGGSFTVHKEDDELIIEVERCPAVRHILEHGGSLNPIFHETTRAVCESLCQGTPYAFELTLDDENEDRCVQRFFRETCTEGRVKR